MSCGKGPGNGHAGAKADVLVPTLIDTLKDETIVHIACGFLHAGCVTAAGSLFTWGCNADGETGHSSGKDVISKPKLLPSLEGVRQASFSRGEKHAHSMCVDAEGTVYSWGSGYKGKLGHADDWTHKDPADEKAPRKIEAFAGVRIKQVAAGGIHSAAVDEEGNVYTWGCGSDGRLGHPEVEGHKYLYKEGKPRKVEGLGNVQSISCSYYHMIVSTSKTAA